MTDPNKTLIAALLDRSGSMETSKPATEDGWRELIAGQRELPGECAVTLAQFDTEFEVVYPPTSIADVPEFVVHPRGMTALLDAAGRFITDVGSQLAALPESQRPGQVICLIMTDGMENASREWTWEAVQQLVTQQQQQWNWKFMFIGANIDAIEVGGRLGVSAAHSLTYDASDYATTVGTMQIAREMIRRTRSGQPAEFSDEDRRTAMGQST
ncbi:VWA domain-containing protein [Mycolicibacterium thermoresistibile]